MPKPTLSCALAFLSATFAAPVSIAQDPLWTLRRIGPVGQSRAVVDTARSRALLIDESGAVFRLSEGGWSTVPVDGPRPNEADFGLPNADPVSFEVAYDSAREVVIYYEGIAGETWEFDTAWRKVGGPSPIAPRSSFALGYDRATGKVVLHGGAPLGLNPFIGVPETDTWEWDGTAWNLVDTGGPARRGHEIEFDPVTGGMLLYGGRLNFLSGLLDDTWLRTPAGGWAMAAVTPPGSGYPALTVDEDSLQVLLVTAQPLGLLEVSRWNGSAWSSEMTDPFPTTLMIPETLLFDPVERIPVVMSDGAAFVQRVRNGTIENQRVRPRLAGSTGLVFDRARGLVIAVDSSTFDPSVTWELTNGDWRRIESTSRPQSEAFELTYDEARAVTVLFGGVDNPTNQLSDDTWEWNGSDWTLVATTGSPSPRAGHAVAYDAARSEVVLFGGVDSTNTRLADTWIWDGTSWTERVAAAGAMTPEAREGSAMAYDAHRQRVVLFGGHLPDGSYDDETWEWNGANWLRVAVGGPLGRADHAMAYDPARRRTVMQGGFGDAPSHGTWEWDGAEWRLAGDDGFDRREHSIIYVEGRVGRLVTSGAGPGLSELALDRVPTGCVSDVDGLLQDIDNPRPLPGETVRVSIDRLPSTGIATSLIGFEPLAPSPTLAAFGLPNCSWSIADPLPAATFVLDFLGSGSAQQWTINIPDAPEAVGVRAIVQTVAWTGDSVSLGDSSVFVVTPPEPAPL